MPIPLHVGAPGNGNLFLFGVVSASLRLRVSGPCQSYYNVWLVLVLPAKRWDKGSGGFWNIMISFSVSAVSGRLGRRGGPSGPLGASLPEIDPPE